MIERLYARLQAWLTHAYADRVIVLLGFALLLPSLDTGLAADDYLHTIMLDRPSPIEGFERAPLDIFRFCDPSDFPALLRQGVFSWWDDPHTKLAFFRPISAATHVLDHALFRGQGWAMHLHSALWVLLLLFGVRALYRALIADRLLANLALALYALDDARGWQVSWVAARNAAIATGLSVWTLVAHLHARAGSGWRRQALAVSVFACALLAGEGSIAICFYLLGYALFLERGGLRARLLTLWPYLAVVVVWRVLYRSYDFGAYGSGLYLDPLTEPVAFVKVFLAHAPLLLGAQLGGMWSDTSTILFALPRVAAVVYCVTCLFIAWVGFLMVSQLRHDALARFAGLGTLCALVLATFVSPVFDRMLTWVAIGASILMAQLIAPSLRAAGPAASLPGRAASVRVSVALLLISHLVQVALLPSRARGNLVARDTLDRGSAAVPRDASISDKTLIYVNPALLPYAAYLPMERAGQHVPRPRAMHILAVATTPLDLRRVDPFTLRLAPRDGFLLEPTSKLLWSEHRPFSPGERIVQGDMTVTILRITSDRRPLEIEARFERPLEDPSYLWVDWRGTRSMPFTPPAVGERRLLAGADYVQAILGIELPFSARL